MRLYIKGAGVNVCAHGGQIVDLRGQRTTDIHLATQMTNMFTGGVAITIIRTYLVTTLNGIEDPVAAGIDLKIFTDIHTCALQEKVTVGIDNGVITDIDTRQRPQQGLIAQHGAIAATELLTVRAQDHIAPAIQLQVSGI
ncbi:Uncharacterised protein [Yersinia intermedia]|nr:Uncharacterised protein [Yersinia intermedia]CNI82154.1 Uncharacterised protein [Yersinia intermedia]